MKRLNNIKELKKYKYILCADSKYAKLSDETKITKEVLDLFNEGRLYLEKVSSVRTNPEEYASKIWNLNIGFNEEEHWNFYRYTIFGITEEEVISLII